jgi:hypothetical protein
VQDALNNEAGTPESSEFTSILLPSAKSVPVIRHGLKKFSPAFAGSSKLILRWSRRRKF